MTVLSALSARIASDFGRGDITSLISSAIADAIEHWKTTRFFFNETRAVTFTSTATQSIYTSADSASIPLMFAIDGVYVTPSGGTAKWLGEKTDFNETHDLILVGAGTGEPYRWSWFDRSIYVYPVPDVSTYTFRLIGAIEKAAPEDDTETDSVWVNEAFDLIRCHAKGLLALHSAVEEPALAVAMLGQNLDGRGGAAGAAYRKLRSETTGKRALGTITPTQF